MMSESRHTGSGPAQETEQQAAPNMDEDNHKGPRKADDPFAPEDMPRSEERRVGKEC